MKCSLVLCNVFLVLAVACLGGCFNRPEEAPEASDPRFTGPGMTSSVSTPTTGPTTFILLNHSLQLSACQGMQAFRDLPEPLWPGPLPPGWEDDGRVTVYFEILECQRIAVGPFERGPVFIMRELHLFPLTPSKCTQGDYDDLSIVEAYWVSDAEVAAHLNQTYAMPAAYADFRRDQTSAGPLLNTTWTFGLPGLTPSWLRVVNATELPEATIFPYERMAWINQYKGITYLNQERAYSHDSNPGATGKIRPPLPYTTTGQEDFATDRGGPIWKADSSGTFSQFRDLSCDEPV